MLRIKPSLDEKEKDSYNKSMKEMSVFTGNLRHNQKGEYMKKGLIYLFLGFFSLSIADPIVPTILNEVQTAPDSLQRIELAIYPWEEIAVDSIVTSLEKKVIGETLRLSDYYYWIIPVEIDKEGDEVEVYWRILYGDADYFLWDRTICNSNSPPYGSSLSFIRSENSWGMTNDIWYIDPTPTFGMENDDWGNIRGKVLDEQGKPIEQARVEAIGKYTEYYGEVSWMNGKYIITLGVGRYLLQAKAKGYKTQVYPESIDVENRKTITDVDFILTKAGIEEEIPFTVPSLTSTGSARDRIKIAFILPKGASVKLKIYDASGKLVRFLLNREISQGAHTISWNGCNNRGRILPSGIYFIMLEADSVAITKRILLL